MTRDQFESWQENPVTQDFLNFLKREAETYREIMASGIDGNSYTEIGEKYNSLLVRAGIYELIVDIEYNDLYEDENESRQSED